MTTPYAAATRLPAADLDRARDFYADVVGLQPSEVREGGLLYRLADTSFALFASSGAASGTHTQMGLEVDDVDGFVARLREHGVVIEADEQVEVGGNYPSKGTGERANWFFDAEGNLLGVGQASGRVTPTTPTQIARAHVEAQGDVEVLSVQGDDREALVFYARDGIAACARVEVADGLVVRVTQTAG